MNFRRTEFIPQHILFQFFFFYPSILSHQSTNNFNAYYSSSMILLYYGIRTFTIFSLPISVFLLHFQFSYFSFNFCGVLCVKSDHLVSLHLLASFYFKLLTSPKWIKLCCASSLSHVQLFAITWAITHQVTCPCNFPSKNTAASCHFLLQGIFPTRD